MNDHYRPHQMSFNPANYHFEWTEDGGYNWDYEAAHKAALKARNAEFKRRKEAGYMPRRWTHRNQLISKGGIGSGNPHIQLYVTCYIVE